MPHIEIYTSPYCGYCIRAKSLFSKKGVPFEEIDVAGNEAVRAQMVDRAAGRRTVPQIFINGAHVGGCDDLYALDAAGRLDPMLKPGS